MNVTTMKVIDSGISHWHNSYFLNKSDGSKKAISSWMAPWFIPSSAKVFMSYELVMMFTVQHGQVELERNIYWFTDNNDDHFDDDENITFY